MRESIEWTVPPQCRITEDQYRSILKQVENDPERWLILLLGGNTGLRISEVLHLEPAHFIPGTGIEVIRRKKKPFKRSILNVPENVIELVLEYIKNRKLKPNDWLFPGEAGPCIIKRKEGGKIISREQLCDGGHISVRWTQVIWDNALVKAGLKVKGRGIHTLRHYDGTRFYKLTKDIRATQIHLGHSSPAITQKYADVVDMQEKAEKVGVSIGNVPWKRKGGKRKG